MPAKLNSDLLDLVVDELAGDKSALSACALASSVLRRRARHHLFSVITISSLGRAIGLTDLLDADPTLGGSVASLSARIGPLKETWLSAPGRTGLCELLPRFPHLVTLTFNSVDFAAFERESGVGPLADALPASLRRLRFYSCDFGRDGDKIGVVLLSGALRLRSLVVNSCVWTSSSAASDSVACVPVVEPEDLHVVFSARSELDRSWLSSVSARRLVSLTVALYRAVDVLFWQVRIDQAGPVMCKLVLVNYAPSGASCLSLFTRYADLTRTHADVNVDLSSLTMLRELTIIYDRFAGLGLGPLVRGLGMVASPCLERATLLLRYSTPKLLLSFNWDALRGACEAVRSGSPQLRVVIGLYFKPRGAPDGQGHAHLTESRLRECERVVGEAIIAHGMEKMVSVELMRWPGST
jgi:hypothetical protein